MGEASPQSIETPDAYGVPRADELQGLQMLVLTSYAIWSK
jgi:hypothetical protein